MRIFLIGYMGVGKTTFGKRLAQKLELKFIDLDHQLEKRHHKTVVEMFNSLGEDQFRKLEQELLEEYLQCDNYVLATGGGTSCSNETMQKLNKFGTTIYLKMLPETLAGRLVHARKERPLIKDKTESEMFEYVNHTLAHRETFYQQARIVVDAEKEINIDVLVQELMYI